MYEGHGEAVAESTLFGGNRLRNARACLFPTAVSFGKHLDVSGSQSHRGAQATLTLCIIMPHLAHLLLFLFFFVSEACKPSSANSGTRI